MRMKRIMIVAAVAIGASSLAPFGLTAAELAPGAAFRHELNANATSAARRVVVRRTYYRGPRGVVVRRGFYHRPFYGSRVVVRRGFYRGPHVAVVRRGFHGPRGVVVHGRRRVVMR